MAIGDSMDNMDGIRPPMPFWDVAVECVPSETGKRTTVRSNEVAWTASTAGSMAKQRTMAHFDRKVSILYSSEDCIGMSL